MNRWFNSFGHALSGLIRFFKTERNARIELVAAILALVLSFWLNISILEFCLILVCIGAVLSAEAFNSSIEKLADVIQPQQNARIKAVKDIAAGAVLLFAFISLVIGIIIFGKRILILLQTI